MAIHPADNSPNAFSARGASYMHGNNTASASASTEELIKNLASPVNATRKAAANALVDKGIKAVPSLLKALGNSKTFPTIQWILLKISENGYGHDVYNALKEKSSSANQVVRLNAGRILLAMKNKSKEWLDKLPCGNRADDYDEIIRVSKKALNFNPDNYDAYGNIIISYDCKKEYDNLIWFALRALELYPQNIDLHEKLIYAYIETSKTVYAGQTAEKVLKIIEQDYGTYHPPSLRDREIYFFKTIICYTKGDIKSAKKYFKLLQKFGFHRYLHPKITKALESVTINKQSKPAPSSPAPQSPITPGTPSNSGLPKPIKPSLPWYTPAPRTPWTPGK